MVTDFWISLVFALFGAAGIGRTLTIMFQFTQRSVVRNYILLILYSGAMGIGAGFLAKAVLGAA